MSVVHIYLNTHRAHSIRAVAQLHPSLLVHLNPNIERKAQRIHEKKIILKINSKKEDDTKSNQAESDREHEFKY